MRLLPNRAVFGFICALLAAPAASARPLLISELDDLSGWLECREACDRGPAVDVQTCLEACGDSVSLWEKDGVAPVSRNDWKLATLETADGGRGTEICYRDAGAIVVPAALCPGALCEGLAACSAADCEAAPGSRPERCLDLVCEARPARTAQDCADVAGDGIPAWIKRHAGLDPSAALNRCVDDTSCDFRKSCAYNPDLGAPTCVARDCGASACTAFHLELISADDHQAIVHVVYDHSPVPPRVLDLHVVYDRQKLLLEDARPLPNLTAFGEQLAVDHSSSGVLRLTVWNPTSSAAVRPGPIVELVFQRTGTGAANIAFSKDNTQQRAAIAPLQGDVARQGDLADDALWGSPVVVPSQSDVDGDRLLLWYGFESATEPEDYRNVPTAEWLCGHVPECALETDLEERAKILSRLGLLQAGSVAGSTRIEGVTRDGAYLDGASDHLELPVQALEPLVATSQGFSYAMWFYTEGNTANERADEPQVLFAHNGSDERTRFGLLVDPSTTAEVDTVSFFTGDLLSGRRVSRTPIATDVARRTWHHVGFSLDAATGKVELYFDGIATGSLDLPTVPAPISCPGLQNGSDILLHEEGDLLGGTPPERIWFGARANGRYSVNSTDPNALDETGVIADPLYSSRDVDVSPVVAKLAYVSNASGNDEVWIADLDGTRRVQVTAGFGDAGRGITVRRPRWAPDGSGLVFESNAYSLPDGHNEGQGFQLYFLGFDTVKRLVTVELDGGVKATRLDYASLVSTQAIGAVQLTRGGGNSQNAWWLLGKGAGGTRGTILFDASDAQYRGHVVKRMQLPTNLRDATSASVSGLGATGEELRLLSAYRRARPGATPPETVVVLYEKGSTTYPRATQFSAAFAEDSTQATVTVRYAPNGLSASCSDTNRNRSCDTAEDLDGNGSCNTVDCQLSEIRNLYVAYDPALYEPLLTPTDVTAAAAGSVALSMGKPLFLTAQDADAGSFVRVEVRSPADATPLRAGLVARLKFRRKVAGTPTVPFEVRERLHDATPWVDDLATAAAPWKVELAGLLDEVVAGVISPDGARLLLYGTSQSRPELFRSVNLRTLAGGARVGARPQEIRGLSWVREQRYFPCNWVGAYRHPTTKRFEKALRGGVDDVKVWAGVRVPGAFRSEAARGLERLEVSGRNGAVASRLPACSASNSECPAFHVCVDAQCVMAACSATDPYACATTGGRCQARPVSVEQQASGFDFVCSSDCQSDRQCFTESCLNGPCRFCDERTTSCIECRNTVQDYGTFTVKTVEGCPDSNAFRCESGSCVTECYASQDGQTVPLCDPTLEYCSLGRCVLRDWDWPDFAPASLSGLSETVYTSLPNGVRRSVAIGEMTPVSVKAFGVGDRGIAPELLVEGRFEGDGASLYGGEWFRIGKVTVENRTQREAAANPYVMHVAHPITALRMRMIQSPYRNLDAASTGLGASDKDFCKEDLAAFIAAGGAPAAFVCQKRPPGSVNWLGYDATVPDHVAAASCLARGDDGCLDLSDPLRRYAAGGTPSIVVVDTEVDGASATILTNRACSYEGTTEPFEPGTGRRRKLFYGDIATEQSPAQAAYCATNGCATTGLIDFTATTGGAWGLLNCNYNDEADALAAIEFSVPPFIQPSTSAGITETANSCFVELDQNRREACYEYLGGNVSFDPLNAPLERFRTLEFTVSKGFGHDRGFTSVPVASYPLTVVARNLTGTLVVKNRTQSVTLTTGQPSATFSTPLPVGRRFSLTVGAQPSAASGTFCVPDAASAIGAMGEGPKVAQVICSRVVPLGGTLTGLPGDRVALRLSVSNSVVGDRVAPNGRFDFNLTTDGAFTFPAGLLEGVAWTVSIIGQPRAPAAECSVSPSSGVIPAGGFTGVSVTCEQVLPRRVGGVVSGLQVGSMVELTNSATGETVAALADGPFTFTQPVNPGRDFAVTVSTDPAGPLHCEVGGGAGTMPNRDLLDIAVSCTERPTYVVPVEVVGLQGKNLAATLNGGTPLPLVEGVNEFPTRLLDGASFTVAVSTQPILPGQNCKVFGGVGVVQASDVTGIRVVCANLPPSQGFTVGGSVTGLSGPGLKLLNLGADFVEMAGNGSFVFPTRLRTGDTYEVTVGVNPTSPVAICTVTNGRGRIGTANVSDVQVACAPAATLLVRVGNVGPTALGVRAILISNTSRTIVGRSRADAMVGVGGGDIVIVDPNIAGDQTLTPPVVLPAGAYSLQVLLNTNQTTDNQEKAIFDAGDKGFARAVTLVAGQAKVETATLSSFVATQTKPIMMTFFGLGQNDATARCFWSLPTGTRLTLPPLKESPVWASARMTCPSGAAAGTCWVGPIGITDANEPLITGATYDLTCWVDRGRNGGTPDGVLGAADLAGFVPGVVVSNSAAAAVTLGAP